MACKDHVVRVVGDNCVGMSGGVVKKLQYLGHCVLGRVRLLCSQGSKCCKHSAVDASCIVEESANDFLDEFLAFFGKSERSVKALGILCFCTVVWFDMGV